MTESNETSQVEFARIRRRGRLALWLSVLCGAGSVAILIVVLLSVYNAEKKYAAGLNTITGLEAQIARLHDEREVAEEAVVGARKREAEARDRALAAERGAKAEAEKAEARRAELARVWANLKSTQTTLQEEQNRVVQTRDQQSRLLADIRQQQEILAKLQVQTAEEAAQAQQMREDIKNLGDRRKEVLELERQITSKKEILADLAVRESSAREVLAKAQTQANVTIETQRNAQADLKIIVADVQKQRDLLTKLRVQSATDAAQVQRMQDEIRTLDDGRKEVHALQKQMTSQKEVLVDLAVRESAAREVLAKAQAQAKIAMEAQEKGQADLKAVEAELTEMRRQLEATRTNRSVIASEVAELTVSHDRLQKKIAELQAEFDALEAKTRQARRPVEPGMAPGAEPSVE